MRVGCRSVLAICWCGRSHLQVQAAAAPSPAAVQSHRSGGRQDPAPPGRQDPPQRRSYGSMSPTAPPPPARGSIVSGHGVTGPAGRQLQLSDNRSQHPPPQYRRAPSMTTSSSLLPQHASANTDPVGSLTTARLPSLGGVQSPRPPTAPPMPPIAAVTAAEAGASNQLPNPPQAADPFAAAGIGKATTDGGALDLAGVARLRVLAGRQTAAVRSGRGARYDNFDIVLDHFSCVYTTPHTLCDLSTSHSMRDRAMTNVRNPMVCSNHSGAAAGRRDPATGRAPAGRACSSDYPPARCGRQWFEQRSRHRLQGSEPPR